MRASAPVLGREGVKRALRLVQLLVPRLDLALGRHLRAALVPWIEETRPRPRPAGGAVAFGPRQLGETEADLLEEGGFVMQAAPSAAEKK